MSDAESQRIQDFSQVNVAGLRLERGVSDFTSSSLSIIHIHTNKRRKRTHVGRGHREGGNSLKTVL